MGNENKINGEDNRYLTESKSAFLPEVIEDKDEKPVTYSLSDEFAKTKRNRTPFIYLAILAFIGALVTGTLLLTGFIQKKFRDSTVAITAFEDLRLIEILDKSKKMEGDLNRAREELKNLRTAMDEAMLQAKSPGAKKAVEMRYRARMQKKQKEVRELQKQIDSYDARLQENIKKAEDMVSNYRKLHRMELDRQRDKYEARMRDLVLKYNPWFTEKDLKRVLGAPDPAKNPTLTDGGYAGVKKYEKDYELLMKRMQKIPYRNSVSPALDKMESNYTAIRNHHEALWIAFKKYRHAFDFLSRTQPESGYIVDPRDKNNMYVYLKSPRSVKEGTEGLVFRQDDELIGKISFFTVPDGIRARVIELKEKKTIQPFDKILIRVTQEQP